MIYRLLINRFLVSIFFSFCCFIISATETDNLLLKLDSLILNQDKLHSIKESKINQLRKRISEVRTLEEEYWLNKSLYEEFSIYDSDSAHVYVDKNMSIASELNNESWKIEWKIKRAFLLTATGLLKEASDELEGLSGSNIPSELLTEYYGQNLYLYSHLGHFLDSGNWNTNTYYQIEALYKDSVMMYISKKDPLYLWYKGWHDLGSEEMHATRTLLENAIRESSLESRRDAMNAYILSMICKEMGDNKSYFKYLIYSAIIDVQICNRDIASIEELSRLLYEKGDIDRAAIYINYFLHKAQIYRNRVRIMSAFKIHDQIQMAYQKRNKEQENHLYIYLALITLLSLILFLATLFIYRQMQVLKESRKKLDDANRMLQQNMSELSQANQEVKEVNEQLSSLNNKLKNINSDLNEANRVKEEYIGYVFTVYSQYIKKLENFRKNINRKVVSGKIEEIKSITNSTNIVQEELKEFYKNFDSVFLHIYPNFVNDFNSLLRPEERITLKDNEQLNSELRIYALVRLGINDSTKIAEFLHYSPQTVYNYRLRIRNKSIMDKDNFAIKLMSLGKNEM